MVALSGDEPNVPPIEQRAATPFRHRYLASVATVSLILIGYTSRANLMLLWLPLYLYAASLIFQRAWVRAIRDRQFDVQHISTVMILLAPVVRLELLASLTFVLGLWSQQVAARVRKTARTELVDMFRQHPNEVWRVQDGSVVRTAFNQVRQGDCIVVYAGETIPIDGTIALGIGQIDQHMLTGESQPAELGEGDAVYALTVLLSGELQVYVQRTGEDTVVAQIGDVLNNTLAFKPGTQLWAEEVANKSVLPTLILGGALSIVGGLLPLFLLVYAHFKFRVSLSASLATLNYFRILNHAGILVKDGRVLDQLAHVDVVVFDKTGTLTTDRLELLAVQVFDPVDETTLFRMAAAVEQYQAHPIAAAIVHHATARGISIPPLTDTAYQLGLGISAVVEGQTVHVGSPRYMAALDIDVPQDVTAVADDAFERGNTVVFVALGGALAGTFELQPTVRPEATAIIAALQAFGIRDLMIISGDRDAPTRHLADQLGISQYYAETLPGGKASIIERLRDEGRTICYIGDGINDAIALRKAQVSVSLSGASTVAIDTAQVLLLDKSLRQLPRLFEIGKDYQKNMHSGLGVVIAPSVLAMALVILSVPNIPLLFALNLVGLVGGLGNGLAPGIRHQRQIADEMRLADGTRETPGQITRGASGSPTADPDRS